MKMINHDDLRYFLREAKPLLKAGFLNLAADGNTLTVTVLQDWTQFQTEICGIGYEPFCVTLADKPLRDFVKFATSQKTSYVLTVPEDRKHIEVQTENLKLRFELLPTGFEFPVRKPATERIAEVDGETVRRIFASTMHAVSVDESRTNLNGFSLSQTAGKDDLVCVATDGHRLAALPFYAYDVSGIMASENGFFVPTEAGKILAKIADDETEFFADDETLEVRGAQYSLRWKNDKVCYPNWRQVVPKNAKQVCTLDRDETLKAIKAFNLSPKQDCAADFERIEGTTTLTPDETENFRQVSILGVQTDRDFATGINLRYLRDALDAHCDASLIFAGIDLDYDPLCLQGPSGLLTIVMPCGTEKMLVRRKAKSDRAKNAA